MLGSQHLVCGPIELGTTPALRICLKPSQCTGPRVALQLLLLVCANVCHLGWRGVREPRQKRRQHLSMSRSQGGCVSGMLVPAPRASSAPQVKAHAARDLTRGGSSNGLKSVTKYYLWLNLDLYNSCVHGVKPSAPRPVRGPNGYPPAGFRLIKSKHDVHATPGDKIRGTGRRLALTRAAFAVWTAAAESSSRHVAGVVAGVWTAQPGWRACVAAPLIPQATGRRHPQAIGTSSQAPPVPAAPRTSHDDHMPAWLAGERFRRTWAPPALACSQGCRAPSGAAGAL